MKDKKMNQTKRLLESINKKIDKLVEQRVQSLVPMLVEHEVNRLLREERKANATPTRQKTSRKPTKINSANITESLKDLVGDDMGEWRSLNYNTQTGIPSAPIPSTPMTTHDGRYVNTSDPNVQKVMSVMSSNLGDKFKDIQERSRARNGAI